MPTFHREDWFSDHIPTFEKYLGHLAGTPCRAMEIGVLEGRCTCWMLENIVTHKHSEIVCVDPWKWAPETYAVFCSNVRDWLDRVEWYTYPSQYYLRKIANDVDDPFDFIYIDGDHEAKSVLEDAVLSFPLLKRGGIMAFDDYHWNNFLNEAEITRPKGIINPPKMGIDAFLAMWVNEIEVLEIGAQVWIRKKAA